MSIKLHNLFLKPDMVEKENYGIYFVVRFICALSILTASLLLLIGFIVSNSPLVLLNIFGFIAVVYVFYLNHQGSHMLAIGLFSTCMYLYAVNATIIFGWQSGFQYYLIPLTTIFFLYPKFKGKLVAVFALFPFITFLLLFIFRTEALNEQPNLSTFLHSYNALNIFLALAFVNYYFRTSVYRLLSKLDKSSNTDMLTGLMNRRSMGIQLSRSYNLNKRYENISSVLIIDIDNFKHINDSLGHMAGDSVLKQFAETLSLRLRESDFLARWGGDEFLLLAPFTNLESATKLADELKLAIEQHVFYYEQRKLNITITIGVKELSVKQSLQDSLKTADQLLYQGKKNGRNQVTS